MRTFFLLDFLSGDVDRFFADRFAFWCGDSTFSPPSLGLWFDQLFLFLCLLLLGLLVLDRSRLVGWAGYLGQSLNLLCCHTLIICKVAKQDMENTRRYYNSLFEAEEGRKGKQNNIKGQPIKEISPCVSTQELSRMESSIVVSSLS